METSNLTVKLPKSDAEFLKQYAQSHGSSVSQLINQYVKYLQSENHDSLHPDIKRVTGVLPQYIDAQAEYHRHFIEKHK